MGACIRHPTPAEESGLERPGVEQGVDHGALEEGLPEAVGLGEVHALEVGPRRVRHVEEGLDVVELGEEREVAALDLVLHAPERPDQGQLLRGEVGAEGELLEPAPLAVRDEGLLQALGEVPAAAVGDAVAGGDLAGGAGLFQQLLLEAGVGHLDEGGRHLLVGDPP